MKTFQHLGENAAYVYYGDTEFNCHFYFGSMSWIYDRNFTSFRHRCTRYFVEKTDNGLAAAIFGFWLELAFWEQR